MLAINTVNHCRMFSSAMKDEAGGIMCQGVGLTQINNSESFFKLLQDTLCKLNNFFIILGSHTSVQTTWHFGLKKWLSILKLVFHLL
jgi:hypothetical protein